MAETKFERVTDPGEKIDALLRTLQGVVYRVNDELSVVTADCSNCAFLYELKTCPFEFQDEACEKNFQPLFANFEDSHGRGDFLKKLQELVRQA